MSFHVRKLFRDVAISAVAFSVASVVGLLLVPVLIAAYGLAGYGQIVLARVFLPAGIFGFLDFGVGETATQVVASSRASSDARQCARRLTLMGATAVGIGSGLGVLLAATATWLPAIFGMTVDPTGMRVVFFVTAAALPIIFLSLVLEGVVKGFEDFASLRSIEVFSTLAYAGVALILVSSGASLVGVSIAFVGSLLLRALLAGTIAWRRLADMGVAPLRWADEDREFVHRRGKIMGVNKVLGTCQTQVAPVLIGVSLGPAGLGLFDALARFPRFAKAVLGLLSSTVLPIATRLDTASDSEGMRRLGRFGILAGGLLAIPPIAAAMAFSEPILRMWIGDAITVHWRWQALMFLIPALNVITSFSGTALLPRDHVATASNRIIAWQVGIQFAISLATLAWLGPFAFILGQVVAVVVTFFAQMALFSRELGIGKDTILSLVRLLGVAALAVGLGLQIAPFIGNPVLLLVAIGLQTLVSWGLTYFLILHRIERQRIKVEVSEWVSRRRMRSKPSDLIVMTERRDLP